MKSSYRIKYLFGAPIIVIVGLAGTFWVPRAVAFGNQASQWAHELKHSSQPVTMDIRFVPTYVDGEKIGSLRQVVVQRSSPGAIDSLRIAVDVSHPERIERFGECRMVLSDLDDLDPGHFKHMLNCTNDSTGLVPFGQIAFGETSVPLFVEGDDFSCSESEHTPPEMAACIQSEVQRIRNQVQRDIQREVRQNVRRVRDNVRVQVRGH
jgi:hypothetical protein